MQQTRHNAQYPRDEAKQNEGLSNKDDKIPSTKYMKEIKIKKKSSKNDKIFNTIQMNQSEIKHLCNKYNRTKTIMTKNWSKTSST